MSHRRLGFKTDGSLLCVNLQEILLSHTHKWCMSMYYTIAMFVRTYRLLVCKHATWWRILQINLENLQLQFMEDIWAFTMRAIVAIVDLDALQYFLHSLSIAWLTKRHAGFLFLYRLLALFQQGRIHSKHASLASCLQVKTLTQYLRVRDAVSAANAGVCRRVEHGRYCERGGRGCGQKSWDWYLLHRCPSRKAPLTRPIAGKVHSSENAM